MWHSILTVTPDYLNKTAEDVYNSANAHIYLVKNAAEAKLTYALAGKLYLSKSGWLLLDIPNALIRGAFDALHEPGVELPYNSHGNQLNAHVSVMRKEEVDQIGGDKITERGHTVKFNLGALRTTEPAGWKEMSKVWFLEIKSPELEKIRKSYGLPGLPKYPFHVTIAVRKKNILKDNDIKKAYDIQGSTNVTDGLSLSPDATNEKPVSLPNKTTSLTTHDRLPLQGPPDGSLAAPNIPLSGSSNDGHTEKQSGILDIFTKKPMWRDLKDIPKTDVYKNKANTRIYNETVIVPGSSPAHLNNQSKGDILSNIAVRFPKLFSWLQTGKPIEKSSTVDLTVDEYSELGKINRDIQDWLTKTATKHNTPVIKVEERKGNKLLCPHCSQVLTKLNVYIDSKGWTFCRSCLRNGKGSISIPKSDLKKFSPDLSKVLLAKLEFTDKTGSVVSHQVVVNNYEDKVIFTDITGKDRIHYYDKEKFDLLCKSASYINKGSADGSLGSGGDMQSNTQESTVMQGDGSVPAGNSDMQPASDVNDKESFLNKCDNLPNPDIFDLQVIKHAVSPLSVNHDDGMEQNQISNDTSGVEWTGNARHDRPTSTLFNVVNPEDPAYDDSGSLAAGGRMFSGSAGYLPVGDSSSDFMSAGKIEQPEPHGTDDEETHNQLDSTTAEMGQPVHLNA